MGIILLLILFWAGLITSQAELIEGFAWPVQALFYCVAGIVWIAPLKPLLFWMEHGRWR
jgi:hypothetical protein